MPLADSLCQQRAAGVAYNLFSGRQTAIVRYVRNRKTQEYH